MLSVLFGLAGMVVGVLWLAMWGAWAEFLTVLKGAVPPFLILVGLVAMTAGISSMKDNAAAKKEEENLGDGGSSAETAASSSEEKSE